MEDINDTTELILQLLNNTSPEFGARLKQRLNKLLIKNGRCPFDERGYGYKRFSDFLQNVLGNKISIERPKETGDILVSLRHPKTIYSSSGIYSPSASPRKEEQSPVIRSDVWQAFTNPDPERKRFFHKETHAIRHFLREESSPSREVIEHDPSQFIEIDLISGQVQMEWMRDFLDLLRMPSNQRPPLDALIAEPYSSRVNVAFTRALGEHGDSWRRHRIKKITSLIQRWAKQNDVLFNDLCVPEGAKSHPLSQNESTQDQLTPRQQAIKLLEFLSEEDIACLVIPTLLSTILVKSRI